MLELWLLLSERESDRKLARSSGAARLNYRVLVYLNVIGTPYMLVTFENTAYRLLT